jgi:hypothetical protein
MNDAQNCDSYIIVTNLSIALICWAQRGDVICFLSGKNKLMELS